MVYYLKTYTVNLKLSNASLEGTNVLTNISITPWEIHPDQFRFTYFLKKFKPPLLKKLS